MSYMVVEDALFIDSEKGYIDRLTFTQENSDIATMVNLADPRHYEVSASVDFIKLLRHPETIRYWKELYRDAEGNSCGRWVYIKVWNYKIPNEDYNTNVEKNTRNIDNKRFSDIEELFDEVVV